MSTLKIKLFLIDKTIIYRSMHTGFLMCSNVVHVFFLHLSVQVCLYFYNKLHRGNRVTKVDAGSFNAFSSPNLAPLATAEVDIKSKPGVHGGPVFMYQLNLDCNLFLICFPTFPSVNWDTVWRPNTTAKFQVSTELNRNVGLLRLFPGITSATVS